VRVLTTTFHSPLTAKALKEYLEEGTRDGDGYEAYLGQNENHSGQAWGRGSDELRRQFGLDPDNMTKQHWQRLFDGCNPVTGKRLIQTQNGVHRPGYDVVWSPPKSISIEMIYASPERRAQIEDAWLESVKVGLGIIQDQAVPCTKPSGKARVSEFDQGDLIVHLFTHYTSRPTPGRKLPDVGVHTHTWIQNLAFSNGRWAAVNGRRLSHKIRRARYACESDFTDRLQAMGYKIDYFAEDRKGNRSWELAGSAKRLRDFFSSRSKQVEDHARAFEKENGRPPSKNEVHDLARKDRSKKTEDCHAPSWGGYQDLVEEAGFDIPLHERMDGPAFSEPLEQRRALAWEQFISTTGVNRSDACFKRYEIPETMAASAFGFLSHDETEQWIAELEASEEFVLVRDGKNHTDYDLMTTRSNLRQEYEATATAICMGYEKGPAPSKRAVDDALRNVARKSGFALDAEQIAAVRHMTSSARWAHLVGHAGTGKSTCMKSMIAAYKAEGLIDRVIVVSVAGSTAQRIGEALNADGCYTVEGLAMAAQKVTERTLVILDEAVMCDTPRLSVFTNVCRRAIVRCVGDPLQLEAIGAGGAFRSIDDAIGHIELTRVHRQKVDELRHALADLRAGRATHALNGIEKLHGLHVSDDYEHAVGELMAKYAVLRKSHDTEKILIITDAPNVEIDRLNRLIQDKRREWGELGKDSLTLEATVDKRKESFHKGDLIAFTEGYEDSEHNVRVRNGTRGVVTRVAPWGLVVRTNAHESVSVYLKGCNKTQPVRLAYAGHAVRTQGHEAKIGLVLPWLQTTDRGSAYSMTTRVQDELHVFVHDREALAAKWKIHNAKATAEQRMSEADYEWEAPEPMLRKKRGLERV